MEIGRNLIIELLYEQLKNNPNVYAFWLEGADASGLTDEYSDLDIWFDVEDGKENLIFSEIEKILEKLGPLDFIYEQEQPHDLIHHKVYHVKNTATTLLLDICIQSHSRKFFFTIDLPGEEVKIIFDKDNVIKFKEFDERQWNEFLEKRIYHLKNIFHQDSRVIKMIKRREFIDAFNFYYKFTLQPLTELLRIKYAPKKQIFLKYISQDLPEDLSKQLEDLYKINSLEEMFIKLTLAKKLFNNVLKDLI